MYVVKETKTMWLRTYIHINITFYHYTNIICIFFLQNIQRSHEMVNFHFNLTNMLNESENCNREHFPRVILSLKK